MQLLEIALEDLRSDKESRRGNVKLLENICKELGVKIGEEWEGNDGYNYRISNSGKIFRYNQKGFNVGLNGYDAWGRIFNGELKPVWKPQKEERVYTLNFLGEDNIGSFTWKNTSLEQQKFKEGIIFRTEEEAKKWANVMLEAVKEGQV